MGSEERTKNQRRGVYDIYCEKYKKQKKDYDLIRDRTDFFCNANYQMRCRRRRSRRQNMSADFIHNQQVSFGICANGVRQLRRDSNDWW